MTKDYLIFYRQLAQRFAEMGCICPSSPSLAKSMSRSVRNSSGPKRILEVGAGTGPITRQILGAMSDEDTLDICEINEALLERLRAKLAGDEHFQRHQARVHFIHSAVQDLRANDSNERYDSIICSLPFKNFPPDVTDELMYSLHSLLKEEGTITFFEYVGLRAFRRVFTSAEHQARIREVDRVIKRWRKTAERHGEVDVRLSLLNLPPARSIELNY